MDERDELDADAFGSDDGFSSDEEWINGYDTEEEYEGDFL